MFGECRDVSPNIELPISRQLIYEAHILEPAELEQLSHCVSLGRILNQARLDEVLGLLRTLRELFPLGLFLADGLVDRRLGLTDEGGIAGQTSKRNDSHRPTVHLVIVRVLFAQLWSHVERATQGERLFLARLEVRSETKIGQLDLDVPFFVLFGQQILRLKVAMHDVEPMHVVEGKSELSDDVCRFLLRKFLLALNHVKQVPSSDQFHHNVVASIVLQELKDSCDVRMNSLLQNGQLVLVQFLVHIGHFEATLANDLNRTWHLGLFVLAQFDSAEGPTPNLFLKDVMVRDSVDFLERFLLFEAQEVLVLGLALFLSQATLSDEHILSFAV